MSVGFVFFPQLLRSLLTFHQIRQDDLSRILNRSQSYVSNVLIGITTPTASEAEVIRKLVNAASVDDIFSNVREDPK